MYDLSVGEEVYVRNPYTQQICIGVVTAPPASVTVPSESVYLRLREPVTSSGYGPLWAGFVVRRVDCVRQRVSLERARQEAAPDTTWEPQP